MQIIKDIEQGSDEWLKLRMGVATASNFNKIITATTAKESSTLPKYALELATQHLLDKPEETYKSSAMQRGSDLEPLARQAYQESSLCSVEEIAMFKSDCGNFGYSPDGLIGDDGLIEIKCPLAITHLNYILDGKMPKDYIQQVQCGLWVSERKWCDFVSYHPNFKEQKLFIVRVERDEDYISKLSELAKKTISIRDEYLSKLK